MTRLLAVLLACLLFLPGGLLHADVTPVLSDEQALAIARTAGLDLPVPGEMDGPNPTYTLQTPHPVWEFTWMGQGAREGLDFRSLRIDAETRGVLSYWSVTRLGEGEPQPVQKITYTRSEAKALAEGWISRLAPDLQGLLQLIDLPIRGGQAPGVIEGVHHFAWNLTRDGYRVETDSVSVSIDAATGRLRGFWRPFALTREFPLPAPPPREDIHLALQYRLEPHAGSLQWRLVYRLLNPARVLTEPVPPAEQPWRRPEAPLSKEQAQAVAMAAVGDRTDAPPSADYETWAGAPGGFWRFAFTGAAASVDTETGLLVALWQEVLTEGETPVTQAEARNLAVAFIRRHRPDLSGQLLLLPAPERSPQDSWSTHVVQFAQTHDGLEIAGRTFQVSVHPRQPEVIAFEVQPFEAATERFAFPPAEGLISLEAARDTLVTLNPAELVWTANYQEAQPVTWRLSWAPRWPDADCIDARTGALLDQGGNELRPGPWLPADLAGHPSARTVELLGDLGIIRLAGGDFGPDRPASVAELSGWLQRAAGYQPEEGARGPLVARETFASWAVEAMGYGKLARMKNRIELPFRDAAEVTSRYANAVAILNGLGILPGAGETRFEPSRPITRAEAAEIILAMR